MTVLVDDPRHGFRAKLPDGFVELPAKPPQVRVFERDAEVVSFDAMGGVIGREPLNLVEVQRSLPGATLQGGKWKSFDVSIVRAEIDYRGKPEVSYAVQIPIKREAIQVNVVAPTSDDAGARAVLSQVLATMEGESNWLTKEERSKKLGEGAGRLFGVVLAGLAFAVLVVVFVRRVMR